jgi:hypothetical protein
MMKRSVFLALGIAALTAISWSGAAVAKLSANGINLGNGIKSSTTALQAVRLAMPDGTEVNFR